MAEALYWTFFVAGYILAVVLFIRGTYASFKAAAHRKPGVSRFAAIGFFNLIFRDSLYTAEGVKWATTCGRCMLGFMVTCIGVLVVAAATGHH